MVPFVVGGRRIPGLPDSFYRWLSRLFLSSGVMEAGVKVVVF